MGLTSPLQQPRHCTPWRQSGRSSTRTPPPWQLVGRSDLLRSSVASTSLRDRHGEGQPHAAASSAAGIAAGEPTGPQASTSEALPLPSHHANGSANGHGEHEPSTSKVSPPIQSSPAVPAAPSQEKPKKGSGFVNRVIFGTLLGFGGGFAVLSGQWLFLAAIVFIAFQATREYFTLLTSKGITKGMTPPPPAVTALTTVLCVSIALSSGFIKGRSGMILAVSAIALLVLNVIAVRKPKFSQLTSTVFGVFYCGWLPSFWMKLRSIATPAPEVPLVSVLQGYIPWTVGLIATMTAVACVIAADTGAYFVGKNFGRTKLTDISPKKTVEGALGGMASSVGVAMLSAQVTHWPATPMAAAGLGVLVFFASLFGDLIESIIKRDAEMKDSGDLIPGHGGLLDRFDSYMFTGAVVYAYSLYVLGAV